MSFGRSILTRLRSLVVLWGTSIVFPEMYVARHRNESLILSGSANNFILRHEMDDYGGKALD